ncbi:MAG: site-specific integrase [Vampirovibrionales bacterium]|nr:site-specific integrase [Vampirovibrionales bacterium]
MLSVCQSPLDRALLTLLASTGLRASECCQLRVSDIDFQDRCLRVRLAKGGKTRRVGLPDRVIEAVQVWLESHPDPSPEAWLFRNRLGESLDRHGLYKRLERLGKMAGVKVSPHALRRAFVTINAGKGRPLVYLQKACGHSDIKTTMGYCLTTEAETVEAMKHW